MSSGLARARTTSCVNRAKIRQSREVIKRATEIIERIRRRESAVSLRLDVSLDAIEPWVSEEA